MIDNLAISGKDLNWIMMHTLVENALFLVNKNKQFTCSGFIIQLYIRILFLTIYRNIIIIIII